jgi:hypothetical protein
MEVSGNYSNNENYTTKIAPSVVFNRISVQFTTFQVAINGDFLTVYDGPDISSPVLGSFNGANNPESFTSSDVLGSLIFQFISNGGSIFSGWNASVICENITCPDPSGIQVSNLSKTTAELSWIAGSPETKWEIEYEPTGFTSGTGIVAPTTLNTHYPLSGLSPSTTYDVYVRTNCGPQPGSSDSSWIVPISFTAFCGTVTAPFYEDFSSSTTPICWQKFGSQSWDFSTLVGFQAANAGDYALAGGTNYAWIDGSPPNGAGQISNLRTMRIDVSK